MDLQGALGIALTAVTIVLVAVAIYAVYAILKAVRALLQAVEDVRGRLVPLLEKTDITVDALNAELLRLDAIVTQAEGVGDAVSTASEFLRSPVNSAARGAARLIRAFGKK